MPVPRRVLLYWLLLLLPTLAAGGGALWLLQREQARIDAQAAAATAARRTAIEARARLIVENIELFMGDVQNGLSESLRAVPMEAPDRYLDDWERNNPLIQTTFRTDAQRRLIRPRNDPSNTPIRASLEAWLAARNQKTELARAPAAETADEASLRRDVTSNVAVVQSARSAVQDVASARKRQEATAEMSVVEPSGWVPWRDGRGLHLLGWRAPATTPGTLVGVVVNLEEIRIRLESLLPRDGELADAFLIRDRSGAILQEKRYRATSASKSDEIENTVVIPIAGPLLPGWEVVGVATETTGPGAGGRGFLILGGLLVSTFMAAILAGGGLLLRQARESAAEAERKTSFVANVSHEFKTPLTTIRLYAELLSQKRVKNASQADDYLRVIGQETERLTRLVNNALDFSRLEQGRKHFNPVPVDLTAEINRILDVHTPRVSECQLQLIRHLPDQPLPAVVDRDALEQIVLNLVDNACKYAAEGGELTVSLEVRNPGARLRVADRGPGIPPEHRERIFDKFHRVDDNLTADKSGAGLGLSIARQLARGLGGDLRHEPRPDGGSVFVLDLP
ncbi:MAG TPA: ATP-binding protein [Opitutaceae bacterium]|nr:sensor histidine kinase [Opitutaceae bacterium]HRE09126.1 ATP-binding protein [Opitutaceae bacterium]